MFPFFSRVFEGSLPFSSGIKARSARTGVEHAPPWADRSTEVAVLEAPAEVLKNDLEESEEVTVTEATRNAKKFARIALKLLFGAVLILILMLFSSGEVDFVYKGF